MKSLTWLWFLLVLAAIAGLSALGPAEKSLGANVRVVYLHGAWVWTSLAVFLAAGLAGLAGLVTRGEGLNLWSRALGRTGLSFWITYIPIAMWAMETNWNGLFLVEPRFRVAAIFAVTGLLLQIGVTLLERPSWASAANLGFILALYLVLQATRNVMHPPSPILEADSWRIQAHFAALLLLTMLAAALVARLWRRLERASAIPGA
ncbi:MAG: hypothetical protein PHS96_00540 [Anaerolineales bacterium]|nr:hypothetical protein [Anaerolineales bacterium]